MIFSNDDQVSTDRVKLTLSCDEIREITGKRRKSAQVRALRDMGLRHWVRPDGKPVVPVSALDGKDRKEQEVKPDFDALEKLR